MKCTTPCIYYRELIHQTPHFSIKTICEARDKEIKDIPQKEIESCKFYKTYKDIKWKI